MIHHRSKISRLPEGAIQQINEFLDANTEYSRIIDWLTQQGHTGIQEYHISRWRTTGYQDWLHTQEHLDEIDRKLQWAAKQANQGANSNLQKAAMGVIALKLYDAFNRADSADISKLLDDKPEKIATLINSFARYSHEVLEHDKFLNDKELRSQEDKLVKRERLTEEAKRKVYEELQAALRLPASMIPVPVAEPQKVAPDEPQINAKTAPDCA